MRTLLPAEIDLEAHLNDDTRILASVLVEALGEEDGRKATCALIERAGGLQLRITSPRTVERAIDEVEGAQAVPRGRLRP